MNRLVRPKRYRQYDLIILLLTSIAKINSGPQSVYTGNQDENTEVGTSILSVLARDSDQTGSTNALVEYSLIRGDVKYFSVDPSSGVISNQLVLVSSSNQMPSSSASDGSETILFSHLGSRTSKLLLPSCAGK